MKLDLYDDVLNGKLKSSRAISVVKCKLFYVHYGRNAWHSTWISRYKSGSMHLALESAKYYVERNRVQGSVFRISEIPGLAFKSSKGYLIITEINTKEPLMGFEPIEIKNKREVVTHGRLNSKFSELANSFNPFSECWPRRTSYSNSVLIFSTDKIDFELTKYNRIKNYQHISSSQGRDYRLFWNPIALKIKSKSIDEIILDASFFSKKHSKEFLLFIKILGSKRFKLSIADIEIQFESFKTYLKNLKFPKNNEVWIYAKNRILEEINLNEIKGFLSDYKIKVKKDYPNPYVNNRAIDMVISIFYPIKFLKEFMDLDSLEQDKMLMHLKLVLVRSKLKIKNKGNIEILFYDGFMNSTSFRFPLNQSKENLLFSFDELQWVFDNLQYEFDSSNEFLNIINVAAHGDWKINKKEPFYKIPKKSSKALIEL